MKILVLSHPCAMKPYRRKFEMIAEKPDVEMTLVLPSRWIENSRLIRTTPDDTNNSRLKLCPLPIVYPEYTSRFFYVRKLRGIFKRFQPDIVHVEEEPWSMSALQAQLLRKRFCPTSKLILRTSLVVEIERHFARLPIMIERYVLNNTDAVFALSTRAIPLLENRGYFGRVEIFPNGVDPDLFKPMDATEQKRKLGLTSSFVIGYIGRLLWMKGVHLLLEASAKLNFNHQLVILGRGDYKGELKKLAENLRISNRIVWVDAIDPDEVPIYMNMLNVLVLPSLTTPEWVESFGRVLAEAMMCGVPVIGSNSGAIPSVIGDAGMIFREGDSSDLADKLTLLAKSETLSAELSAKGIARSTQLYSWRGIADKTHRVYRELLEADSP